MYYLIKEKLEKATIKECMKRKSPYVAVVSSDEFKASPELYDMGIDMEIGYDNTGITCVDVNYDSLTGAFSVPDRKNISGIRHNFLFALDEKGIAIINDDGYASAIIEKVQSTRKWRFPCLERFIYDFLEEMIAGDLAVLEKYETEMDGMEDRILDGDMNDVAARLADIRSDLLDLRTHYEQLVDLGQELEENENGFFNESELRFFHMFNERVVRLQEILSSLREHTMQVRDLYHYQLEVKQNRIMTILTVVSTIFMPLTLVAGWYGMNFKYMPELEWRASYPVVTVLCAVIVIVSIIIFKKKKLL